MLSVVVQATPTDEELELMYAMVARVRGLCKYAAENGVRIMIDAEHNYLQPAIDSIAKDMMREFNKERPTVYNTYQCYLKDSRFRLNADIESARRQGYKFGAKLVRGAYMDHERKVAKSLKIESPVHDTPEATHSNYNRCVRMAIQEVATAGAEVMIATHNQYSVEMAVRSMHDFGMKPSERGVFFGQLLGMADHLSYVLGRHKYRAYKYVPFGPLEETMPYLIRRAQENSDMMGGVAKEMNMLRTEFARRVFGIEQMY
jgi:proline dehydrogenase